MDSHYRFLDVDDAASDLGIAATLWIASPRMQALPSTQLPLYLGRRDLVVWLCGVMTAWISPLLGLDALELVVTPGASLPGCTGDWSDAIGSLARAATPWKSECSDSEYLLTY